MKPEHKRLSRVLGYCLTLGTSDAWAKFSVLAFARLSGIERVALAFAALQSLDPEQAELTAAAALGATGDPVPPFLGGMEEARHWAAFVTRKERKAYALACFEAMPPQDRAAFIRHISIMEATA